jgi:Polyketide cyclase / dehydrase and lipid transport
MTMVEINASREVSAPLHRVWNIISDVNNEPRYWRDLNAVYNIRKNGNVIEREFTGASLTEFKGRQTVVLYPKKSIEVTLTDGPMVGTRIITLTPSSSDNEKTTTTTKINVSWDIKLSNIPLLFRGIVRERIVEATEEALDRIDRAAVK